MEVKGDLGMRMVGMILSMDVPERVLAKCQYQHKTAR
jgi:hypothetical protein